jgi:hypothetical protein
MQKDIVGNWGSDLEETVYGQALAALGVLEATGTDQHQANADPKQILAALQIEFEHGDRTVLWRRAHNIDGATQKSWRETIHENARALAEGWRLLLQSIGHPRQGPRLAVKTGWLKRHDLFDFNALMGWLAAKETGCEALVLMPDNGWQAKYRTLWHWPLSIGVPAVTDGEPLLDCLRNIRNGWIENLGILQPVGEARDACDLLILPPGIAAYLAEQPRLYLQASFIACLDEPVTWSAAGETSQARLREKVGAAGIVSVGKALYPGLWYEDLMRELSHDLPVHAAVWRVDRSQTGILPVVVGEPEALDRLRIATIGDRIDRKLEMMAARPRRLPKPITRHLAQTLGYPGPREPDVQPEPAPEGTLGAEIRSRLFSHETVDGLPIAAAIAQKTGELEGKRVLRYIQAQAWREDVETSPARALAPERPGLLTVFIGPSAEPLLGPFPDHQFDFTAGPVTLTVQIELAGASVATIDEERLDVSGLSWVRFQGNTVPSHLFQLAKRLAASQDPIVTGQTLVSVASAGIQLPLAGDSSRAVFALWPQPGVTEVTGRISIIHQNRVVQTARLTARCGTRWMRDPRLRWSLRPSSIRAWTTWPNGENLTPP